MATKKTRLTPHQELMQLEKRLYLENQKIIKESTVVDDKRFKSYFSRYRKATKSYQRKARLEEVLNGIESANVIYFGDYHTLDQSQRSFVRLLRAFMKEHHKKFSVAIEAIESRHQKNLQNYMVGKISDHDFIKKIGFRQSWFFDLWENYETVFDFLNHHHIPIRAIDADLRKDPSLKERDQFMAEQIIDQLLTHPKEKIMVLVGDLHLAPSHLPKEVERLAKAKGLNVKSLTLYQNSPDIYWQLLDKRKFDQTPFVKIDKNQYCRMHTPPLIVQQSYLNWLYHEGESFDWIDAKASFLKVIERISQFLRLKLPDDYEDVDVYTCGDLSFIERLKKEKAISQEEFEFIQKITRESSSYFFEPARLVYLANVSMNHAADEASEYLRYLYVGDSEPLSPKDAFYAKVLEDAVSFFGSKIINLQRKCLRASDYQNELNFLERSGIAKQRHLEHEVARLFLRQVRQVREGRLIHSNQIASFSSDLFLMLAHAIGQDFGDALYYGLMAGKVTKAQMRHLYQDSFDHEGEPGKVFLHYHKLLKGLKRPVQL